MCSDYPSLTPEELAVAGQALFGAAWRTELARAVNVREAEIVMVESGRAPAPLEWRARLVAIAQDVALRAMSTANELMWRGGAEERAPAQRQPEPRYA